MKGGFRRLMSRGAAPGHPPVRREPRRASAIVALALLVVVAGLAGCTRAEPVNPNLLAPKLILDVAQDGDLIAFVHSAFGERTYDRIELSFDNETLRVVEHAYSLEERLNSTRGFLHVAAASGDSTFAFRGVVALDDENDRFVVSALGTDGEWAGKRPYSAPFERILEREPEVKE